MARTTLPRDVDLTIKMDFNDKDNSLRSLKLPKEERDLSYKRYHKYKKTYSETTSSTLNTSYNTNFHPTTAGTATLSGVSNYMDSLFSMDVLEVEEKVCWRKLFKDPELYGYHCECGTEEEAKEHLRNLNFPLGSKQDRANTFYEIEQMKKEFGAGYYCDCCGKKINIRNCLSHSFGLCENCNQRMQEATHAVRLS